MNEAELRANQGKYDTHFNSCWGFLLGVFYAQSNCFFFPKTAHLGE